MRGVTSLERDGADLVLECSDGSSVRSPAVLLAMGASYRRLGVPALEALLGARVYYGSTNSEASFLVDREAFVVGGANSAGQAALHLANYARKVTLVVRGDSIRTGMSEYLVSEIEATPNIDVRLGAQVIDGGGTGRLEHLVLADIATGTETSEPADALFVLIGAQPFTEMVADRGGARRRRVHPHRKRPSRWHVPPRSSSVPPRDERAGGVRCRGHPVRLGEARRVCRREGSIAVQMIHRYFAEVGHEPRRRNDAPVARTDRG